MTKRHHPDDLDFIDRDGSVSSSLEQNNPSGANSSSYDMAVVVSALSRMIMTRIARSLKIRRENLQPILQKHNVKRSLPVLISEVNKEMTGTLGLAVSLKGSDIVVTSSLEPESKQILYELWSSEPNEVPAEPSSRYSLMPLTTRSCSVVSTPDEIQGGLMLLTVSIVVLCGNRVNENELLQHLASFGFPEHPSSIAPILNRPTQAILDDLTRKDYLRRNASDSRDASIKIVDYSLGEKSIRDIGSSGIYEFIVMMFNSDEKRSELLHSMQKVFPDFSLQEEQPEQGHPERQSRQEIGERNETSSS